MLLLQLLQLRPPFPVAVRRVLVHGAGAISCVLMFWMGDITEPLWATFIISRELRHSSKVAYRVYTYVSPVFTAAFLLVRSVLGPPMVAWLVYTLWFRTSAVPLTWRISMGACLSIGIIGSQVGKERQKEPVAPMREVGTAALHNVAISSPPRGQLGGAT